MRHFSAFIWITVIVGAMCCNGHEAGDGEEAAPRQISRAGNGACQNPPEEEIAQNILGEDDESSDLIRRILNRETAPAELDELIENLVECGNAAAVMENIESLLEEIENLYPEEAVYLIRVLGRTGDRQAVPLLIDLYRTCRPIHMPRDTWAGSICAKSKGIYNLRDELAYALGHIGGSEAALFLLGELESGTPGCSHDPAVPLALGIAMDTETRKKVDEILHGKDDSSRDELFIKSDCIIALARHGTPEALDSVMSFLADRKNHPVYGKYFATGPLGYVARSRPDIVCEAAISGKVDPETASISLACHPTWGSVEALIRLADFSEDVYIKAHCLSSVMSIFRLAFGNNPWSCIVIVNREEAFQQRFAWEDELHGYVSREKIAERAQHARKNLDEHRDEACRKVIEMAREMLESGKAERSRNILEAAIGDGKYILSVPKQE